jgi:branched-subunit amino acid aminotransferase/4-amino-4-deoxychorismate lyase
MNEQFSFVSINGKRVVKSGADVISIHDTSFHRGDGVFEVMRIVRTNKDNCDDGLPCFRIRSLPQHMERLQTSACAVHCPLPPEETLMQWLQNAVDGANQEGSLRLIATKGNTVQGIDPSVIITWSPLPQWPDTFTLYPLVAPWHPAGLPGWETPIKWTSYGPNIVSSQKAQDAGFTDALLLSPHRIQHWEEEISLRDYHILDGPNFSIAFLQETATPDVQTTTTTTTTTRTTTTILSKPILHLPCNKTLGLLPSITQSRIAAIAQEQLGMEVVRNVYTLGQLLDMASEVYVMSTTRGIKTVTQIGEFVIGRKETAASAATSTKTWGEQLSEQLQQAI